MADEPDEPKQTTPAGHHIPVPTREVSSGWSSRSRRRQQGRKRPPTAPVGKLLIELYERGELPAGELAAAARLTPATVTQMLEHLADCGHVE
jgi:DNA-binding MarR family transcriptional regulator